MKKFLIGVIIFIFLFPISAMAAVDLSEMSFDDLIKLKTLISVELTKRPEWKEVTVPQGVWKVGEDIPAGHWTITASEGNAPWVIIGSVLEANGLEVDTWESTKDGSYFRAELESPTFLFYKEGKSQVSFDVELKDGVFVQVRYASVVFSPYTGRPSLGF